MLSIISLGGQVNSFEIEGYRIQIEVTGNGRPPGSVGGQSLNSVRVWWRVNDGEWIGMGPAIRNRMQLEHELPALCELLYDFGILEILAKPNGGTR